MDELTLMNVKSIKLNGVVKGNYEGKGWRTIVITNHEGREFMVSLFGKLADLELMELMEVEK
jgi:hypothetical protein